MADAQISVLIEAQDKITATLSRIEGQIDKFGKANQRASEGMATAWQNGTNKLIAIGNVAASVDNIFSSLTNLELRLENATERLANAQDRLADSSESVADSQKDVAYLTDRLKRLNDAGITTGEQVWDLQERLFTASKTLSRNQKEEERAKRSLTIAENGLARAQNQVIGTYIGVGVQTLSLVGSLPTLFATLGPVGLAFGAVAAAAGLVALVIGPDRLKGALEELSPKFDELKEKFEPIITQLKELFEKLWPTVIKPAIEGMIEALGRTADALSIILDFINRAIDAFDKLPLSGALSQSREFFRSNSRRSVGDAVIRPDGSIIETDPRDTLVAMRDIDSSVSGMGGGITIHIRAIYGLNPTEISRALKRELGNKISI